MGISEKIAYLKLILPVHFKRYSLIDMFWENMETSPLPWKWMTWEWMRYASLKSLND